MTASEMLRRVADFIREEGLVEPELPVVAGVSGGVDSMVLLDLLARLDFDVLAAHVNYRLRGEESDADEELVRRRAASLGVPLETARYATREIAAERGQSIQEAARDLRYAFFGEVAAAAGAPVVAVAHHAEDQAETLLLNLFRGTGIDGLAGMRVARLLGEGQPQILIRPLLKVRRRDLEAYARERDIIWREDASNESRDYLRTFIRHEMLPAVAEAFDADVALRVARTAGFVRAYLDEALEPALREAFEACAVDQPGGGLLYAEGLNAMQPAWRTRLVLEALGRWLPEAPRTAAVAAGVAALLEAQTGRRISLPPGEVWREREGLCFVRGSGEAAAAVAVPLEPGVYPVEGGVLTIRRGEIPADLYPDDEFTVVMDADKLPATGAIRVWQDGDVMRPLGLGGRKKVSDLLTDAAVPSNARARMVVMEAADEVVWVPGVRLADSVRVNDETAAVLMLTYAPAHTA